MAGKAAWGLVAVLGLILIVTGFTGRTGSALAALLAPSALQPTGAGAGGQ